MGELLRRYGPGLAGLVFAATLAMAMLTGRSGPLSPAGLVVVLTVLIVVCAVLLLVLAVARSVGPTEAEPPRVALPPPPRPTRPDRQAEPAVATGGRQAQPPSRPTATAPQRPAAVQAAEDASPHSRSPRLAPGVTPLTPAKPRTPRPELVAERDDSVATRWQEIRERWEAEHATPPPRADALQAALDRACAPATSPADAFFGGLG